MVFTVSEMGVDSCQDSEDDLHPQPAGARKVDVDLSEKLTGPVCVLTTVEFRHVEPPEKLKTC